MLKPISGIIELIKFDQNGLVTVVVQDDCSGVVLMVAYMNRVTLSKTLETGLMTYWSRSRSQEWVKGETSGHFQEVVDVSLDCDGDALLFKVNQVDGIACHTGETSCFHRSVIES